LRLLLFWKWKTGPNNIYFSTSEGWKTLKIQEVFYNFEKFDILEITLTSRNFINISNFKYRNNSKISRFKKFKMFVKISSSKTMNLEIFFSRFRNFLPEIFFEILEIPSTNIILNNILKVKTNFKKEEK